MVPQALRGLLAARRPDTHKGDYGHVLLLAGSPGLTGAAALSALGALRCGSGLVTVGVPATLQDVLAGQLTEAMTWALPATKARTLAAAAAAAVLRAADRFDAVGLGPGVSVDPATQAAMRTLVAQLPKPLVVDADGLTALAGDLGALNKATAPRILTPHPGELARLTQQPVAEIQRNREAIAQRMARAWRSTVVLKGHRTVVAHVDGRCYVNETGHAGMASGGMGDVLTGVITSLLGQRLGPFEAAALGVYLHGLAGDLARARVGEAGLLASDAASTIPQAIRQYVQDAPA